MKNTNDKLKVTQEKVMLLKKQLKEVKAENVILKGYVEKFEFINEELDKKLHKEIEKRKLETSKVKDCKMTMNLFREEIEKLKEEIKALNDERKILDDLLNEHNDTFELRQGRTLSNEELLEEPKSMSYRLMNKEEEESNIEGIQFIFKKEPSFFEKVKAKLNKIWYGK